MKREKEGSGGRESMGWVGEIYPVGFCIFLGRGRGSESAVLDTRRAFGGRARGGVDGEARCRRPFLF